jgi:hypothetical protein
MTKSLSGKAKILLIYLAWWLVWILDQALVVSQTGFDWSTAFLDAGVTQLVVAIAGYVINTSMHSYQPSAKNSVYVIIWSVALAALCVALQRSVLAHLIVDDPAYSTFLESTLIVRGAFAWLMIMLVAVLTWFWVYVNDRQETEKRKQDSERLAREAELSTLRLQLQPHFLFNSLNSINALVGVEPERARTMIHQLSDFLRGTVRKETNLITLAEELIHLQLYLEIEKVRFGHRLAAKVQSSEESLQCKIPSLLLQPVVENAIKFGLYDTIGEVTISITTKEEKGVLIMEIQNPFDPQTAQPKKGTGFGLSSVQRRLYLLYAQNNLVQTQQIENTFITTLRIPQV